MTPFVGAWSDRIGRVLIMMVFAAAILALMYPSFAFLVANPGFAVILGVMFLTAELIGVEAELSDEEIVLDERYHAGIYGIPDESTLDAMRLAARTEGMITDPVYEGKSMAGLVDLVTTGEIGKDSKVLYAHLGGQPALNGYSALFA